MHRAIHRPYFLTVVCLATLSLLLCFVLLTSHESDSSRTPVVIIVAHDYITAPPLPAAKKNVSLWRETCTKIDSDRGEPHVNLVSFNATQREWDKMQSVPVPQRWIRFCHPRVYAQFHWQGIAFHMCVWPREADVFVSASILDRGFWEGEQIESMVNALSTSRHRKGLVVDVGANLGMYSLVALALDFPVVAIEPLPEHVDMIARSAIMNGFDDRLRLYRNGVGDYHGQRRIRQNLRNKGGSGLVPYIAKEHPQEIEKEVDIDIVRLDDLPALHGERIVFFKADVEGYETRMFRGAAELFSNLQTRPQRLQFELLSYMFDKTGCSCDSLLLELAKLGYELGARQNTARTDVTAGVRSFCSSMNGGYDVDGILHI
jgi:FkbM family methyltransferase